MKTIENYLIKNHWQDLPEIASYGYGYGFQGLTYTAEVVKFFELYGDDVMRIAIEYGDILAEIVRDNVPDPDAYTCQLVWLAVEVEADRLINDDETARKIRDSLIGTSLKNFYPCGCEWVFGSLYPVVSATTGEITRWTDCDDGTEYVPVNWENGTLAEDINQTGFMAVVDAAEWAKAGNVWVTGPKGNS